VKSPVKTVLAGDAVIVHTDDGRNLHCQVLTVSNTVAGIKIKVQSGYLLFVVNPDQIIEVLK
jgi:hypothetical protein